MSLFFSQKPVTPTNAPRVKAVEENEKVASSSKITQDTPRIHATGDNVEIINSGMDAVYHNNVLVSSTPIGLGSIKFGAGCNNARIVNSGNNVTRTFTSMPSTPRIHATGDNVRIIDSGRDITSINTIRSSQAGPTSMARFSGVMEANDAFHFERDMRQMGRDMRQMFEDVGENVYIANSGNVTTRNVYL